MNNLPGAKLVAVDELPSAESPGETVAAERSDAALTRFLSTSPACKVAASALKSGAEVAVNLTDVEGDWRLWNDPATGIVLEPGKAKDPDFELRIPPRAGQAIYAHADADLGDLGVTFFEHIVAKDPELRIQVVLRSGFLKLTGRGWIGLLARGGPRVAMWMTKRGLRGPGAIATALGRLKR